MRLPKHAGLFYERAESLLNKQIEECFLDERGPGTLPSSKKNNSLKAVIVPHAGYIYSGPCAAWAYKEIAESEMPDLFILMGPNHYSSESGFSMETFETPLGLTRVKQDFARKLSEKGTLKQNEQIHIDEHCLEVQIPFLQFIFKNKIEKINILPILLSRNVDLKKLSIDIKETLMETKQKAIFIISSDFTHYGRNYHYIPFLSDLKKRIYDLDGKAIEFIKKVEAENFKDYIKEKSATICGAIPIELLLRTIKSDKVLLEQYYTSGDVIGDYKNSVSYSSIIFK
ncbi:AmmeMemoRadiSam system protein B [Candidatus Woesearchaeota archaeon]|jgi:hypothetical protein|nr:AmmeMemoRadiSam system protein B [Candidatus Woesearchaeota archaeon]|tara:strand:+ start:1676 stop:2530 length:855 start_codon:yes stop_codon:yes gene_type:complete